MIDRDGAHSYSELERRVNRFANLLTQHGIGIEQRVLLCLYDTIDFHTCFLGDIKAGAVPVVVNTLLTAHDYAYMLEDTRARMLVFSEELRSVFEPQLEGHTFLKKTLVSGATSLPGCERLADAMQGMADSFEAALTRPDDAAFWLYTSGTTGRPKGVIHSQTGLRANADHYAAEILQIREDDLIFSAPKLFFAYGLGNALTFPMAVGATSVLMAERPTPESVMLRLQNHSPTIFFGVPTLYAAMLASAELPVAAPLFNLRCCVSAGEPLPEEIGRRWSKRFGIDLLDGIGSTEMLHIFLSNRPDKLRYGTTGLPVPGYTLQIVDEEGAPVAVGDTGELQISGPSGALFYWNNRAKTTNTFRGPWVRSGDKYWQDEDGYYVYAGRSDDMLKVGGVYVSPIEIEGVLIEHPAVLEVAVVGREDADELVKPAAHVVLQQGREASQELAAELKAHVKSRLAPFKYPRWVEFLAALPKTATGKIQRYKLRAS